MGIVLILMFCFLVLLSLRIIELERKIANKKIEKTEQKEETKEQIKQKNRKEAFGRLMDYSIEKAYESKVK